jgi:hypothetical protein
MPIELEQYYALTGDGRIVLDGWYTVDELRAIIVEAETPRELDTDALLL